MYGVKKLEPPSVGCHREVHSGIQKEEKWTTTNLFDRALEFESNHCIMNAMIHTTIVLLTAN